MVTQSDIRGIKRNKRVLRPSTVILYIILIAGTLVCLVPLYWMLRSSLMSNAEIFVFPPLFSRRNGCGAIM